MVQWREKRVINAPIEKVWGLFSDEQLQNIMPQLEKHQLVEGPPNQVGSKYAQQNRMGQRVVNYVMEITAFVDSPEQKRKDIGFVAAGLFKVSLSFALSRIDDEKTLFVYSGSTTGANLVGRTLLKLDQQNSSKQEVQELMKRVVEASKS